MDNFNFKKKFGQNFIYDTNLLKAIVGDAEINSDDDVLEIGVGAGTLTKEICSVAHKVTSYEIDRELEPLIYKNIKDFNNVNIVFKDFMKEGDTAIKDNFPNGYKVVANLPYYITTPIIFKILNSNSGCKSLTIMVQKEVADRISSPEGSKDYGKLSVFINAIGYTSIKRIVKRNMFTPAPNVDSAIVYIKIEQSKYNILDYKTFDSCVNSAFNHRRKMLFSNLKTEMGLSEELLSCAFNQNNILRTVRGEMLSVEQFVNLSNTIFKLKGNL